MDRPRNILILDDDSLHRHYIRDLIEEIYDGSVRIVDVEHSDDAVNILGELKPDLCIFDLQLPGERSGIDVAKYAWEHNSSQRILFWSQHSDEMYVRKLFSIVPPNAIYGFIIKTALDDKILNAIEYILEYDQCWIDPTIRKLRQTTFDKTNGLTNVEYETLVDLALGLSDNAIANRRFITRRGVQNRLASLYQKLGVTDEQIINGDWGYVFNPRTRALTVALSRGLINQEALRKENEFLMDWTCKLVP
ncbi:MAG TPA: response regulator transcription factor [Balneolales bacterium]|nr:response regulator transcription factor [Balneolales bacterium]